jgi:hypothetical protein
MEEVPSDYAQIVGKLFDEYEMELHEIFVLGPNLELESKSLAALSGLIAGQDRQGSRRCVCIPGQSAEQECRRGLSAY